MPFFLVYLIRIDTCTYRKIYLAFFFFFLITVGINWYFWLDHLKQVLLEREREWTFFFLFSGRVIVFGWNVQFIECRLPVLFAGNFPLERTKSMVNQRKYHLAGRSNIISPFHMKNIKPIGAVIDSVFPPIFHSKYFLTI